jgi:hypothetical protein
MSYMAKGGNDKKSNADSRGQESGEGLGADAIAKANALGDFVEPKNAGGEQGAPAKNHWDGSGAEKADVPESNAGMGYGKSGKGL